MEIILFLMKELKDQKQLNDIDVSYLSKSGYTQSEISSAFTWLFEQMAEGRQLLHEDTSDKKSHRVLHDVEKLIIAPEAYGYLMQFHQLGLLTNLDIENLIERVMTAGFAQIGVAEMKSFIAGMLFNNDSSGSGNTGLYLGNDDTIH